MSRFLLDLRSVYYTESAGTDSPDRDTSTVRFATNIIGNMGATLNTRWSSDDEDVQYSSQPFSVGLLDADDTLGYVVFRLNVFEVYHPF